MSTLKIWREIQYLFKLPRLISSLTTTGSIRNFTLAQLDIEFRRQLEYGLKYIHQFCEKGTMKLFEKLRMKFLLPKTDFFRCLQLRHLPTTQKFWAKIVNPTGLEQFLMHVQMGNGAANVIFRFYQEFLLLNPNNSVRIKQRWEAEMQRDTE